MLGTSTVQISMVGINGTDVTPIAELTEDLPVFIFLFPCVLSVAKPATSAAVGAYVRSVN